MPYRCILAPRLQGPTPARIHTPVPIDTWCVSYDPRPRSPGPHAQSKRIDSKAKRWEMLRSLSPSTLIPMTRSVHIAPSRWVGYTTSRPRTPIVKSPRVIAVSLIFSILAFFAVCLRFYVRHRTHRAPWVDDYAALASSILTLAYAAIVVAQTRWGQGLTANYLPPQNVVMFSKIQYAGGPVYTLDLLFFKLALLASYLRIGGFVTAYRNTIIAVIVAVVINQLICTFIMCLVCMPVAKQWDPELPGKCLNQVLFYYGLAGTSLGFDVIIIILHLPVLWRLQLQLKQKMVLTFIFALGFFVTIIQIIRIFSVKNLKTYTDSKNLILWSIVEVSLGVIISCIPTYGPLFKAFASTVSSYRQRDTPPSYPLSTTRRSGTPGNSKPRSGDRDAVEEDEYHNTTMIRSNKGTNWRANGSENSDADSQQHILQEEPHLQIHTTTEVTVERT